MVMVSKGLRTYLPNPVVTAAVGRGADQGSPMGEQRTYTAAERGRSIRRIRSVIDRIARGEKTETASKAEGISDAT